MIENSFTPGPWTLETVATSCGICHKIGPFPASRDGGSPRHACLYSDRNSHFNPADQELLANARLIAAAPDLLEAAIFAKQALAFVWQSHHANRTDAAIDSLIAAIAKATGSES